MAITFLEEKKREKYLLIALAGVIILIGFVLWYGFFYIPAVPPQITKPTEPTAKRIKIDWDVLKNPGLDELQILEEIPSFKEPIGRENPFLPY